MLSTKTGESNRLKSKAEKLISALKIHTVQNYKEPRVNSELKNNIHHLLL